MLFLAFQHTDTSLVSCSGFFVSQQSFGQVIYTLQAVQQLVAAVARLQIRSYGGRCGHWPWRCTVLLQLQFHALKMQRLQTVLHSTWTSPHACNTWCSRHVPEHVALPSRILHCRTKPSPPVLRHMALPTYTAAYGPARLYRSTLPSLRALQYMALPTCTAPQALLKCTAAHDPPHLYCSAIQQCTRVQQWLLQHRYEVVARQWCQLVEQQLHSTAQHAGHTKGTVVSHRLEACPPQP